MKKRFLSITIVCAAIFLTTTTCSKQKTGACTISCGGFGTGQPFVSTTYAFKTEQDCKELGQTRGGDCKASYCPPTGNSNDCYQVYP